ncbi:MAG: hypothetical protein WC122_01145 [archaeon]
MDVKNFVLRLKYPTLLVLVSLIIASIVISLDSSVVEFIQMLGGGNYPSFFIVGFLTPLGIFTPFSAAFFINTKFENIILSILLAGLGAVICDSIIFYLLKKFFFVKNNKSRIELIKLNGFFKENYFGRKLVDYVSFALAGWIIAAPLPGEIGKNLILILSKMNFFELFVLSFIVNTIMISSFVIIGLLF